VARPARRRRAVASLIIVATAVSACGSGQRASSSATKSGSSSASAAVYDACARATQLAADFLGKASQDFDPTDIPRLLVSSEREAATVLRQGDARMSTIERHATGRAARSPLVTELRYAAGKLTQLVDQAATSHDRDGLPPGDEVQNFGVASRAITHICPYPS
jgi:hypothetical protein